MTMRESLTNKNLTAEIFSIPVVVTELERMWQEKRALVQDVANAIAARQPRHIVFFGSGGSASALYSGYYAAARYLRLPVDYMISPDVISLEPAALGSDSIAIGASYSGRTVDTLAARDALRRRGTPLLAITRKPDAVLADGAAWNITYESIALYSSPAYLTLMLTVELCKACGHWTEELDSFEQALESLPSLLKCIADASRDLAERGAAQLHGNKLLILSGGCTYSLGYMMAFDMFGEYLKQYCAFLHYGEFRHGPLEIVRSGEPTMMFLMGNDASRPFGEATRQFARRNGAPTLVFDATELAPQAHPLLDALVLYQSQIWLLYYLACERGIDLDAYKYMHITPYAPGDTFY